MKKTDSLTFIGIVVGLGLMGTAMMGGQGLKIFFDIPSIFITVGGSFAALLITYSIDDIKVMGKALSKSFNLSADSGKDIVLKFGEISKKARREGLLSLEDDINQIDDAFLKKGLQMVVDGIEPETIREILELEIDETDARHSAASNVFKTWGAYAPGFGMIGTLIGLIQMLSADMSDAATIASGMSKALITTFYGSLMANFMLNPFAQNLSIKSEKESNIRQMMLEGILAVQSGVNPRIVEEKLMTYLSPKERLEIQSSNASGEGVSQNA